MSLPLAGVLVAITAAEPAPLDDLLAAPVSATTLAPYAKSSRDAPAVVTALTREEVLASGARDLQEVLELIPGISFGVDRAGVVGPGIRGLWGHEGRVLLIIDGIEMNELLTSTAQYGHQLPVQIIERVEVIRGPASALYGGNAALAVISVTTRGARELMGADAEGRYGQSVRGLSERSASLSAGYVLNDSDPDVAVNFVLGQGVRSTGYYSDFSGHSFDMAHASSLDPTLFTLSARWSGLTFHFLYDDYHVGAQDGFGQVLPSVVREDFRTVAADLRYRFTVLWRAGLTPYLSWRLQVPREVTDTTSPLFYSKSAQRLRGGLKLDFTPAPGVQVVVGAEAYVDHAWLDGPAGMGLQTDFGSASSVAYANVAGYSEASWDNDWVNLAGAVRMEWNSAFGPSVAPRLALTKRMDRLHLKLIASAAYRTPGIETVAANPSIVVEQTQVLEAEGGLKLLDPIYAGINTFYMRIANPIFMGTNLGTMATGGWELELHVRGRFGFLRASYALALPAETDAAPFKVPGHNEALLGFAAHKLSALGVWRVTKGLRFGGSAVFFSERYGYLTPGPPDAEGQPVGFLGQQPGTLAMNLWVGYENLIGGLDLSLGVSNLFNAPIAYLQPYEGGHAPLAGPARAFYVRLSYHWRQDRLD
jgi:outer membrane receptor protein involved in Fe transport